MCGDISDESIAFINCRSLLLQLLVGTSRIMSLFVVVDATFVNGGLIIILSLFVWSVVPPAFENGSEENVLLPLLLQSWQISSNCCWCRRTTVHNAVSLLQ